MGVRRGAVRLDLFGVETNTKVLDADGCEWWTWFESGWDSADLRGDTFDLTGRHGVSLTLQLYGGRRVVLGGSVTAPDTATAWEAYNRVGSSMPLLGQEGELVLYEPVPKRLVVARGGEPRLSEPSGGRFQFRLTLVAHDPFKRALTARTTVVGAGATVAAVNDGSAAAELVVTVTSPGTVILSAGGVTLTTGVLPAGAVIDTAATSITDPSTGDDLFTLVALPPLWPALPAGGGNISQLGTANLSVEHFDTYA